MILSLLPLSGGMLDLCRLPGLHGDLSADITTLLAERPALVLSLTESDEMSDLGAATLPDLLRAAGIDWSHFPIRDFDTPDQHADWAPVSARLHALLGQGGTIIIHCRGGLGRSGMIALRLMIEAGENPQTALTRLRRARPGAIETPAQLAWANATNPAPRNDAP